MDIITKAGEIWSENAIGAVISIRMAHGGVSGGSHGT